MCASKEIILIHGAPGTGKSTVARALLRGEMRIDVTRCPVESVVNQILAAVQ